MNEHTFFLLEFGRIREALEERCSSEEGAELVSRQEIQSDPEALSRLHRGLADFRRILESGVTFPDLSFPPVRHCLPVLRKEGTVLEAQSLAAAAVFLRSASGLRRLSERMEPDGSGEPVFPAEAAKIPDLVFLSKSILTVVDEQGSVRETLPRLKAIRKRIQTIHGEIASIASSYLQDHTAYWQTDIPGNKDGRTVLPLKANYRSRVQGIVHDVSSSGATLFIEPFEIVEKNNDLIEQENRYRQEVFRILKEKTEEVREHTEAISMTVEIVAFLDTLMARAKYSRDFRCRRAAVLEYGIELLGARHPLLGESAVPIDVVTGEEIRAVIISGPNAGGKTVTLKTVGLLALMNQFGMEIPVRDGSGLQLFDGIYADIGDEQSISDSLSTFSGHMKNISEILSAATQDSLVLLDELGGGTDPEEGAALAMAVLDSLVDRDTMILTSSHTGALKNYGFTKEKVVNASVEFDESTLSPTYRIIPGLPGESHALDIASRSGIASEIVDRARGYISEESADVSAIIRELGNRVRELDGRAAVLDDLERGLRETGRANDLRALRLNQKELEIREREKRDVARFVSESRKNLENLVRELREGELTREKTKQVKQFIEELEEGEARHARAPEIRPAAETADSEAEGPIREGIAVLVGEKRQRGTAVRRERNGKWLVSVNNLRITVPESELVPARVDPAKPPQYSVSVSAASTVGRPELELDLRGYRLEEALQALELQLDRAIMSGLHQFSVIHGKGEGILRKGVHDYLSEASAVKDFRFSLPEEGGFGKTVVELKG